MVPILRFYRADVRLLLHRAMDTAMRIYWKGSGRKVTYADPGPNQIGMRVPLILEWNYLGSESTYILRRAQSSNDVDGKTPGVTFAIAPILYLRIPDYGWQETQPRFVEADGETLNDA